MPAPLVGCLQVLLGVPVRSLPSSIACLVLKETLQQVEEQPDPQATAEARLTERLDARAKLRAYKAQLRSRRVLGACCFPRLDMSVDTVLRSWLQSVSFSSARGHGLQRVTWHHGPQGLSAMSSSQA